jgi:tRNA(Ile)-lysidine synthase
MVECRALSSYGQRMHQRSLSELSSVTERLLPTAASGDLLVAFSGGLDSTVLLHALAAQRERHTIRAIHINHGLHSDAAQWESHCAQTAAKLHIEFSSRIVAVPSNPDEGVESAARRVRYEALRSALRPNEALLTAHHADDQLETVLLALMRGSGVDGLAAMPRCQHFGSGWHLRPLLEFTRNDLSQWANEEGLIWLEDPSNDSTRFDRNYLRSEVVPALRVRWPSVAHAASRSASHFGEAAGLLDELAARDFAAAASGSSLRVATLKSVSGARRRNLLRYWLHSCGARAPSTRKLAALEHDMLVAQNDRTPCVGWDSVEVRRHRGLLYCMPQPLVETPLACDWDWRHPLRLGDGSGVLRAEIAHGVGIKRAKLPVRVRVSHREGGERLQLAGHEHHRELKKLLQEANILPWWRNRLPLLFDGKNLVAVADLWVDASYAAEKGEAGVRICWDERPHVEAAIKARE